MPPSKRFCRSLSASSATHQQKRSRDCAVSINCNTGVAASLTSSVQSCGRRSSITRPVPLRISQHLQARSLAVSGVNSPANSTSQKTEAQTLVALGSVRLRNRNRIINPPLSSRLSWHHPISASRGPGSHPSLSANQAHRRASIFPMGRNSILLTEGGQANEVVAGVRLRNPSSLACFSSGSTDFRHQ